MPCPFPGMDPYLEGPHWHSFHTVLCTEIARQLNAVLGERYLALPEERLVYETPDDVTITTRSLRPDVSILGSQGEGAGQVAVLEPPLQLQTVIDEPIRLRFIEVREVGSMALVTVIEVLSPANKSGDDRSDYLRKRRTILDSDVNLIEIDLLRGGQRAPMREPLPDSPYFVIVHRASTRPVAGVWPVGLREPLPSIPIPLLRPDPDAPLSLQSVITGVYAATPFDRRLDYSRPLVPPLDEEDARWVRETLAAR